MSANASNDTQKVHHQLNSLLSRIRTSTREYVSIIDAFPNREGRNLVRLFMKQRDPVAEQLRHTIRHLGGDPTDANLAPSNGRLRATWESLPSAKSTVSPEVSLLNECELMDAQLVSGYEELLNGGNHFLPFAYVEILRDHCNILALEVETLRAYRQSLDPVSKRQIRPIAPQLDQPEPVLHG